MSTILQKYFSAGAAGRTGRRPRSLPSRRLLIDGYFSRLKKKCSICRVCVAIRKIRARADDLKSLRRASPEIAGGRFFGDFRRGKKSAAEDADLAKLRGFFPGSKPEKEKIRRLSATDFRLSAMPRGVDATQASALSNALAKASISAPFLVSVVQASRTFSIPE
jgi:hypothetical protein